jgi:hypothetical protein
MNIHIVSYYPSVCGENPSMISYTATCDYASTCLTSGWYSSDAGTIVISYGTYSVSGDNICSGTTSSSEISFWYFVVVFAAILLLCGFGALMQRPNYTYPYQLVSTEVDKQPRVSPGKRAQAQAQAEPVTIAMSYGTYAPTYSNAHARVEEAVGFSV